MVSPHVVIMEDDPEVCTLLETVIERTSGFSPQRASEGDEVIRQIHDDMPDLIFVDAAWINSRGRLATIDGVKSDPATHCIPLVVYRAPLHQSLAPTPKK